MKQKDADTRRYVIPAIISFLGTLVTALVTLMIALMQPSANSSNLATPTPITTPLAVIGTPQNAQRFFQTINFANQERTIIFIALGVLGVSVISGIIYYRQITSIARIVNARTLAIDSRILIQYLEKRANAWQSEYLIGGELIDKDLIDPNSTLAFYRKEESETEILLLRSVFPFLTSLLQNNTDYRLCIEIVKILARLKAQEAEEQIIEQLKRPEIDLKIACVYSLGEFQSKRSLAELRRLIKNPEKLDRNVLNVSIRALRRIRPPDYLDLLASLMLNEHVSRSTKENYIIVALEDLDTDKALWYVHSYRNAQLEGKAFRG